ncbi:hypothetical protein FISHEDRAFT_51737 [Fistulina hepatica ATCC 64428]|nr:hypothetical protein FISHEDRAFT_51737 [Fistulina hepatica ATCC 64428]
MSSNEEDYPLDSHSQPDASKKRRIQRACDICRRKKSDGVQGNPRPCSNCSLYGFECTYVESARVRTHHLSALASLLTGAQLRRELGEPFGKDGVSAEESAPLLCPDMDLSKELAGDDAWLPKQPPLLDPSPLACSQSLPIDPNHLDRTPTQVALHAIRGINSSSVSEEDLPDSSAFLLEYHPSDFAAEMAKLNITPAEARFFGKSSGMALVQTAVLLKQEYTGRKESFEDTILHARRPEFWELHPWEDDLVIPSAEYTFPTDDLLLQLLDLYFRNVNVFFPLLHRPTFEAAVSSGLHRRDDDFAVNLLLVCALGSRYSDDPRVLLDGVDSLLSAGWKYFRQVQVLRRSMLTPPSLYDLQFYVLSVLFLQTTSAPQACWTMIGIGVRLAQDVGAHRRTVFTGGSRLDNELWKRAFWCLVWMDRNFSAALGRPCATQDEDFDLDYPMEVDDEYYDTSEEGQKHPWRQPEGKPSLITFFNCSLQLNQILAMCLRTIYSINKSKVMLGFVGDRWEQQIVAELDSALNKWVDSVPDHLKWDPTREDSLFSAQSVFLYSNYYHLQILVHRPFIPSPRKPSPLSYPSLAICANAARSCIHVIDLYYHRQHVVLTLILGDLFTAGIVLLFNIWGGKRSGMNIDTKKEMVDVHKCMKCLKAIENRCHIAGRLWDVLFELASFGDLPLPQPSPTPSSNKRDRDADSPRSVDTASTPASSSEMPNDDRTSRAIAGSRRVRDSQKASAATAALHGSGMYDAHHPFFALPMHSDELGRLPLHGDITWFGNFAPSQAQSNAAAAGNSNSMDYSGSFYDLAGLEPATAMPAFATTSAATAASGSHISSGAETRSTGRASFVPPPPIHQQSQGIMDSDTMAMWSSVPQGFEVEDWGTYLSSVGEYTHSLHSHPGT